MQRAKNKYIKTNGISHHYLDWGNPSLQPIILMHATGLCASVWHPIATELATSNHVMAFDQRGHGNTDKSDTGYSFELIGEDLASIIEALDVTNVFVVGHSSGGIATLIADHLLPGRINKALLVETRILDGRGPGGELKQRADRTRMKRKIWEDHISMHLAYRSRTAFKNWDEECFDSFIQDGTELLPDGRAELKCLPEVEATFYEQRETLIISEYFDRLTAKYKILIGEYPGAQRIDDEDLVKFLDTAPSANAKLMGIGSHFLPLEHPQIVLEEIESFFNLTNRNPNRSKIKS